MRRECVKGGPAGGLVALELSESWPLAERRQGDFGEKFPKSGAQGTALLAWAVRPL